MRDVYKRLADKLNQLPQGFPATDNGVELKILKKIFSPEDAEMALRLNPLPETAQSIAKRMEIPEEKMKEILDKMANKGQIGCRKMGHAQVYLFAAFIPGIYEYQLYRLDKELAELVEAYLPHVMKVLGGYQPGLARTIPVNKKIEPGIHLENYEDIQKLIESAKSFNLKACICQTERQLLGHPCRHTLERCLNISPEENAFDYLTLGGEIIDRQRAFEVLENSEREGLVHNAFLNTKVGHAAICNCCSCCCSALRSVKEFGGPLAVARSNFVALIDADRCSACGICMEEHCPMGAILVSKDGYRVESDTCIGCGVCSIACPEEAIGLIARPETQQDQPPDNVVDWMIKRAASRGIGWKMK